MEGRTTQRPKCTPKPVGGWGYSDCRTSFWNVLEQTKQSTTSTRSDTNKTWIYSLQSKNANQKEKEKKLVTEIRIWFCNSSQNVREEKNKTKNTTNHFSQASLGCSGLFWSGPYDTSRSTSSQISLDSHWLWTTRWGLGLHVRGGWWLANDEEFLFWKVWLSRGLLPIVKRQVPAALPDKMFNCSQVHVGI